MSRKQLFGLVLVLVCIILVVLRARYVGSDPLDQRPKDQPQQDPLELPDGPVFVVPESPLGVLGVILALVIAFGISAKAKSMRAHK